MEIPGASLTKLEDHSNYGLPVHPSSKRQLTSTQEAGGEDQYIVEKLVQHRKDANWRPGGLDTKHSKSLLCRKVEGRLGLSLKSRPKHPHKIV